jgi:GAF domain-containing protein
MAVSLHIPQGSTREQIYETLFSQVKAVMTGENDPVANAANFVAALKEAFGFFWVGIYRVVGEDLVLGPFQGPMACTRIGRGKGVCGSAWLQGRTVLVPDVDQFPGHIACSSLSRSEIVVPIRNRKGEIIGVLDVDSVELNDFSEVDQKGLELWVTLLSVL